MAYDERLAARLRQALARHGAEEKKMFGGLAFMVGGSMCCGVLGEDLMARVGPERYDEALRRPHARPMDFTGKPMVGYVYVAPAGCKAEASLARWVDECVGFVSRLPARKAGRRRPARPRAR